MDTGALFGALIAASALKLSKILAEPE